MAKARKQGAFFETLIYQHLRVSSSLLTPRGRLHFWRTQMRVAGREPTRHAVTGVIRLKAAPSSNGTAPKAASGEKATEVRQDPIPAA